MGQGRRLGVKRRSRSESGCSTVSRMKSSMAASDEAAAPGCNSSPTYGSNAGCAAISRDSLIPLLHARNKGDHKPKMLRT